MHKLAMGYAGYSSLKAGASMVPAPAFSAKLTVESQDVGIFLASD